MYICVYVFKHAAAYEQDVAFANAVCKCSSYLHSPVSQIVKKTHETVGINY